MTNCKEALDYYTRKAVRDLNGWHKFPDEKPVPYEQVLICSDYGIEIGYMSYDGSWLTYFGLDRLHRNVKAWFRIPKPKIEHYEEKKL